MRQSKFYKNAFGFTLIELLISMTMLAIIIGSLSLSFRLCFKSMEKGQKGVEEAHALRSIQHLILSQIRSACPYKTSKSAGIFFDVTKNNLNFVTTIPLLHHDPGLYFVSYIFTDTFREDDKIEGTYTLYYYEADMSIVDVTNIDLESEDFLPILKGIKDFSISCLSLDETGKELEWIDEWDYKKLHGLPYGLKIEMSFMDSSFPFKVIAPIYCSDIFKRIIKEN